MPDEENLADTFNRLLNEWRNFCDTKKVSSNISVRTNHPAYQAIIQLGKPVLPLIFKAWQRRFDFWFEALEKITHEDPVPHIDCGRIQKMKATWFDWGRRHGYVK